jgi:hypothetical protein
MKVDLLAICKFSLPLAHRLQNPPANGKQDPVSEEMSQTLLTNKKQGKNTKYCTRFTHLSHPSFTFTGRKMFISIKNKRSPLKIEKPAATLI